MGFCKTCGVEIPDVGKTGRARVFCSEKCKLYYTNFIRADEKNKLAMQLDGNVCGVNPDLLREWATLYALDRKGAFRRKVFEPLYGEALGILHITSKISSLIEKHPGNELLTELSERFNAWKNSSTRSICPVCLVNWPNFNQTQWRTYCSEECCNIAKRTGGSVRESIDSVMIDKYGVRGGFTKERVESFNDEREKRTGYRISTQNPSVKEKILAAMSASERFVSAPEREIKEYFESKHDLEVVTSAYNIISGKQLDLYFPSKRVAVEYNGCFFHSEGNGGREFAKWRHVAKTDACELKGIKLVHVWEDEWASDKDKVLRMLEAKLGLRKPAVYARKCNVVRDPDTLDLYGSNHIQGNTSSTLCFGLTFEGALVAAMSFNKTKVRGVYELTRFATTGVHGAFSKLLKSFLNAVDCSEVYSFGDRCVVSRLENVYLEHGFKEVSVSPPDYKYTSGKRDRIHKFNFRKKVLLRKFQDLDSSWTEAQMADHLGFKRIYGCGLIKYVLKVGGKRG